ncbi:MAG: hypothetical protein Kapaf2KO_16630 [Candidatus Kapaibacteriales bacterium]
MPTVDRIDGVKINIYNGEHRPPHIHAIYNEHEALLTIETLEIYAGSLPPKQMKKSLDWLKENQDWALTVFFELNPELK